MGVRDPTGGANEMALQVDCGPPAAGKGGDYAPPEEPPTPQTPQVAGHGPLCPWVMSAFMGLGKD